LVVLPSLSKKLPKEFVEAEAQLKFNLKNNNPLPHGMHEFENREKWLEVKPYMKYYEAYVGQARPSMYCKLFASFFFFY
jgi:hypothetical protein